MFTHLQKPSFRYLHESLPSHIIFLLQDFRKSSSLGNYVRWTMSDGNFATNIGVEYLRLRSRCPMAKHFIHTLFKIDQEHTIFTKFTPESYIHLP